MKKTNLVLLVLFLVSAVGVWAQANANTAPAFDQQPSVVLDLWSNGSKGKYSDNIIFRNATLTRDITFNVYGYEEKKKEWTLIGTSTLKEYSDNDKISPPKNVKIKNFRWFAVYSPANIKFMAQAKANDSNDIVITIVENIPIADKPQGNNAPAFDMASSKIIDLWEKVKGKYKDNINLKNGIGNKNISFNIWGYDQKNNQWSIIGPKKLSPDPAPPAVFTGWGWYDPSNDNSVDSTWKDNLKEFRWIAIQSLDGLSFNVDVAASSNDLMLTIIK
ncbi:hypothetical protein R84B8_01675 [Treponema sp. R8-4-B8]